MSKNTILALLLGIVIGGLAVWLILGLTGMENATSVIKPIKPRIIPTPTATQSE